MSRDYTEITDEQLRAINKRAVEQPSYEQLREQNRVLREALEEFCKATEYVASRMAYQCGLGAGEWEAFIDQTKARRGGRDVEQVEGCYGCRMLARRVADAQATIAALQDERDGWVRSREHYYQLWMRTDENREQWRKLCQEAQSQLTQRTAERDCVRRRVDELEAREVDVVLLREDLEKRTAELEAAKREVDVWKEKAELRGKEACAQQAELERVRGLVKTYADAKIDFDDKRLQEDHHAWRERYTRLVGAETILIALTATSQEGQG